MPKRRRRSFMVSLDIPPQATIRDVREYIHEAINDWCGQCRPPGSYNITDPGDPMWELNRDSIRVKSILPRNSREA